MSDAEETQRVLADLLALTRAEELDCDGFHRSLPAFVEGTVTPRVRELMEHHRRICPECEEEREVLARALGLDEPAK